MKWQENGIWNSLKMLYLLDCIDVLWFFKNIWSLFLDRGMLVMLKILPLASFLGSAVSMTLDYWIKIWCQQGDIFSSSNLQASGLWCRCETFLWYDTEYADANLSN